MRTEAYVHAFKVWKYSLSQKVELKLTSFDID